MENIELLKSVLLRCASQHLTPVVWGRHGIGKSQIIRQLFEAEGYDVVDLRLGQLEVGDLIGMPAQQYSCPECGKDYGFNGNLAYCPVCKAKNHVEVELVGQTAWLPPSWFPKVGQKKKVIFFDEINRGRLDVQQACFQIVLDRRIHTHIFPDSTVIVCACNPSGGDYYVEELDPALLDRFVNIKFNLNPRDWIGWAKSHSIKEEIIDFIVTDNKALGADPIDIPIEITPSPRSYEFLSKLLGDGEKEGIQRKHWREVTAMIIGEGYANRFMQSLEADIEKPIKAREVFNSFDDAKIQKKLKAQVKANRFDLLRETLDDVVSELKDDKSKALTKKQLNFVGDLLMNLPQDLAFSGIKDLAPIPDVNERLLLPRQDLFDLLRSAREAGGKK